MVFGFCLSNFSLTPYDVKVTLGQYDRCFPDTSSTNVSTERIITHPDYNAARGLHNIALVRLSSSVTFERRISPICLSYPSKFDYIFNLGLQSLYIPTHFHRQ